MKPQHPDQKIFKFIIEVEAQEYKGIGDFPNSVIASEIFTEILKDAKVFCLQMKMDLKDDNDSMHQFYDRKIKEVEKVQKSFNSNFPKYDLT